MRKITIVTAALLAAVLTMTGCGSTTASNEYIEIKQYKGLEIEKVDDAAVTDKDVDQYIESKLETLTSENVKTTIPDRAIKEGDTIMLTCKATGTDGKVIEGTELTDYQLTIGSGAFFKGWESSCIGKPFGKEFTFDLKFPDDYGSDDIAGKKATWTVTAELVEKTEAGKLTDKTVKKLSEKSKTVEEYRKEVKDLLTEQKEQSNKTALQQEIWEAVMDQTEVKKYPDGEVDKKVKDYKASYEQMAKQYGMTYEQFLEQANTTDEEVTKMVKEEAQKTIKQDLITELLLEKLKIKISDDDYKKKYDEFAKTYGMEDGDAFLSAAGEETAKKMVEQAYVSDWLIDNAKMVEPKKEETDAGAAAGEESSNPDDKAAGDSQK